MSLLALSQLSPTWDRPFLSDDAGTGCTQGEEKMTTQLFWSHIRFLRGPSPARRSSNGSSSLNTPSLCESTGEHSEETTGSDSVAHLPSQVGLFSAESSLAESASRLIEQSHRHHQGGSQAKPEGQNSEMVHAACSEQSLSKLDSNQANDGWPSALVQSPLLKHAPDQTATMSFPNNTDRRALAAFSSHLIDVVPRHRTAPISFGLLLEVVEHLLKQYIRWCHDKLPEPRTALAVVQFQEAVHSLRQLAIANDQLSTQLDESGSECSSNWLDDTSAAALPASLVELSEVVGVGKPVVAAVGAYLRRAGHTETV